MFLMLSLATLLLVIVTVVPLWRNPHWVVRSMDFPRLQFVVMAIILLLVQLVLIGVGTPVGWLLISVTVLCLVWHLRWIAPYTRLWPVQVQTTNADTPDRDLVIITANVLATNRDAGKLLTLVRQHEPDVLVTLESNKWWQQQLSVLEQDMPYSIKCPLENLYGMHVYSRLPLEESEVAFLVEDDVPSMHALLQLRSGDKIRVHFLHPAPPSPTENTESAERDAELVVVARSVAASDQPVIVSGDLNDVAWSPTTRLFLKISSLLDPRIGRGFFNTFHAHYPFLRWPLDHVFHSYHFTVRRIERLPPIGSDHFALLSHLALTLNENQNGPGLLEQAADRRQAQEIAEARDANAADVPRPGQE
jgi:endonuclease/exonuclease/phosphatase (EEP) superfamily protein YafD